MPHKLRVSSYHLLAVLRHKSKVVYTSSAVGPSSPAYRTSNLENYASRSCNNQQALMGSISLRICPLFLQCTDGNVLRARHAQNHSPPEKNAERIQKVDFCGHIAPQFLI